MDESNSTFGADDMSDGTFSDTNRKILFDTEEAVKEMSGQLIALNTSHTDLKEMLKEYTQRLDRKMDMMDERHATMDQRVTLLRTDMATVQADVRNTQDDVKDLKNRSNILDFINLLITSGVGAFLYFIGKH